MKLKSKVVLIALGQPSTNPRLLKEAVWFCDKGFEVHVLYCFWAKWGYHSDKLIFARYPSINWKEIGGNPYSNKLVYLFTRTRFKIFRIVASRFPTSLYWSERSVCRCFKELYESGRIINASLYIAHNLGSLPVVGRIASKLNKPFIFDAEDFHRGQYSTSSLEFIQHSFIENYWMPKAGLITAASPLIVEKYRQLLGLKSLLINNVFSIKNASFVNCETSVPVKLFWFSQTIGKGRGLEDILTALKKFSISDFSITILGDLNSEMEHYLKSLVLEKNEIKVDLKFISPVEPEKIFAIASNYDIGLAIEPGSTENNDLIYTNKLFTYLLAGNAILFTATTAQNYFFNNHQNIGWIYPSGNLHKLHLLLARILSSKYELEFYKRNASKLARNQYNWELEQNKLHHHLSMINESI